MRSVLPSTADRVPSHTARDVNQRIRHQTEANAATLAIVGILLGAFVNVWFLVIPAGVGMFLPQHALQGWCPPVPILRRLGFRTSREIFEERLALLAASRRRRR
jgi:hypothetical protein